MAIEGPSERDTSQHRITPIRHLEPLPPLMPTRFLRLKQCGKETCECGLCKKFALDESALHYGETAKTGLDHKRDTTARKPDHRYLITPNRTRWTKRDVENCYSDPFQRGQWKEMWNWQIGYKSDVLPVETRGRVNNQRHWLDKVYTAQLIADQLGCTKPQNDLVQFLMKHTDVGRLGAHSDNITAAIAVTSIVTRNSRQYGEWSFTTDRKHVGTLVRPPMLIEDTPEFESLCELFDIDQLGVETAEKSVRNQETIKRLLEIFDLV